MSDIAFNTDDIDINAGTAQAQTPEVTDLDKTKSNDDTTSATENQTDSTNEPGNNGDNNQSNNNDVTDLKSGDKIEVDGITYTINNNGDLLDDKGNVFKTANELKDFINSNTIVDENDFNITNVINKLGISVTDDDGKAIEFANTTEGVANYVNTVIDLKSNELRENAISEFFDNNPEIKLFADYYAINGTSKGFGDIPDRSGIKLNENNQEQLANVIKMAAKEFNNPIVDDNYIEYLKSTDKLYAVAKDQLNAMLEHDKQVKESIEKRAEEQRKANDEMVKAYWNDVKNIVNSGEVHGYKIPDTFKKEKDGKVITYSKGDFYDYIIRRDKNGLTRYDKDVQAQDRNAAMQDAIMKAWLTYTNNDYSIFIKTAENENAVKTLKLTANKASNASSVRIIRNNNSKVNNNDILLN